MIIDWASKIAQWVPTAKPDNLTSAPASHTVEGENYLPQVILRTPHIYTQVKKCNTHK